MIPSRRIASHALTLVVLIGLGIVVFHRTGVMHQFHANAPGSFRPVTNQAAKTTRPFRVEGFALLDATRPIGPNGVDLEPSEADRAQPLVVPTSTDLAIDCRAAEWGDMRGILRVVRGFGRHIGALTLDDGEGNMIRLNFRLDADPARGGFSGAYRVFGGEGKFEHATGEGSYRFTAAVPRQMEAASVLFEGTLSF
jgi:hypothetical protein